MARPAIAVIDLEAIRHNYRLAKKLTKNAQAFAIIKANAYGHGAVRVAQALEAEVDGFGVACIEEALELRVAGIKAPILLLEGIFTADELLLADRESLSLVVHNQQQLTSLLVAKPKNRFKIFLKIDTGMHRLGFAPSEVKALWVALQACKHLESITLMTHFARADEVNSDDTLQQLQQFKAAVAGLKAPHCLANSPAILAWPVAHSEYVRPGLMLYGASPFTEQNEAAAQLKPAMRLESALIAIRELAAGEPIGYGARFRCEQATTVGVVAMGYADGYPRHAIDGTPIAVNGIRTRLIGRVSMDMLTIDITGMSCQIGDRVECWGDQVLATEVAAASNTIPYTLFTGVTRRVPLTYIG
ncbi:alanine racemase [uncultured Thiothrix sp.]|uniref:alanine racemase n=1 Tax=uncultured Thiothrix sp. TaxID=223185 RepID=UPI002622E67F|nr:alanine racemase [uncultured Thiothrix sp.]HMT93299.1 alanine racemase [Thiolinea sp.]